MDANGIEGFCLRSAMVKSEAQVERRLERNRSATPASSRKRKRAASAAINPAHDERGRSACRADERSTVKRSARWSGRTPSV